MSLDSLRGHVARHGRWVVALAMLSVVAAPAALGQGPALQPAAAAPASSPAIDRPLADLSGAVMSGYASWANRVRVDGGAVHLDADGLTPRGGAGCAFPAPQDLRPYQDDSPILQVTVGPRNQMHSIYLFLVDASGHKATYLFDLPPPSGATATLLPRADTPLHRPTGLGDDKTMPDLGRIIQWHLLGDLSDDTSVVDLQVSGVLLGVRDHAQRAALDAARRREEHAAYGRRTAQSPRIAAIYAAAPDVLALQIQTGRLIRSHLEDPYRPQPGDTPHRSGDVTTLARNGKEIGWLIGPKHDALVTFESVVGDPLLDDAGDPASYTIQSTDDPAFAGGRHPRAVYRKSRPTDLADPGREMPMEHIVYLRLDAPLKPGRTYVVEIADAVNVGNPGAARFVFDPARVRSESVHADQIGFRPDDPVKRAYLSLWLGTGGGYTFPDGLAFHLVDDATRRAVFTAAVGDVWPADRPETMAKTRNFNQTAVYRLDFSRFRTPGRYRVVVDGVGCSYPFPIGPDVWRKAFTTQMRGLFHERGGIALGPPYTTFVKPRDFFPGDGAPVYQSTYSLMDGPAEHDEWTGLPAHSTGRIVPEAWGGYHDAGDWNPRRATHLKVTMAQLELMELFPHYFRGVSWNIPKTSPAPDILNEARFEVDFFHRLQRPDGAVPFGIETDGDPIGGEVSWKQSMPAYVFAPDPRSSYLYAQAAGRLAKVLAPFDPSAGAVYRESAVRAMRWAEADYARRAAGAEGGLKNFDWNCRDDRNLAALVLYDLTAEQHWHDVFLEDTCLKTPGVPLYVWSDHLQRDAAFLYVRLAPGRGDPVLRLRAITGLRADADDALAYARGNAWGLTAPTQYQPMYGGFYSMLGGAVALAREHYLTGSPTYLAGAIQACLFSSGCNPNDMTYTSGLASNPVQHPLHVDSRRTGQPAPEGLTVLGNLDLAQLTDDVYVWPVKNFFVHVCIPPPADWPTPESYFDAWLYPAQSEYTVDLWAPNVFVWGYLAARPAASERRD